MGWVRLASSLLVATVAAGAIGLAPRTAEACGGTFCDNLPQPMPIDQTGENILFVVDGPSVEAHIQINIDSQTEAEKFAWVIPVASMPDFEVGSDPLFNSLLAASVPRYTVTEEGECQPGFDDGGGVGFIEMPDGGGANFEPELEEVVGALEVAVLADGTADEMSQWLIENDYAQDESAVPILEEYIAQGWMFAAVKLANHAGVDDIHPLVMKYENGEPCVPLRLTRIAAKDDMEVRVFFLGDERVAPTNYKHVEVNPLKVDWLANGANYKEVVTLAVDQDGADGKAFVTEFAGASEAVNQFGIYDAAWSPDVFLRAAPEEVPGLLDDMGLSFCFTGNCQFGHPLLLGLMRTYLPAPEGVDEVSWWAVLSDNPELIDLEAWDPAGFTQDFRERIVAPGLHAVELLDTWPYLTRLFTTISPGEMTVDPIFHPHPDLPPVPANRNAIRKYPCELDGWSIIVLPDGRELFLPEDASWPQFTEEMPWEEDIEELMEGIGAPIAIVDNTEKIDELLAEYNAANMPPSMGDGGTTGGDGGTTGGEPGVDFPEDTDGDGPGQDELENVTSGCACQTGRGVGGGIGFGLGLLLAGPDHPAASRRRTLSKGHDPCPFIDVSFRNTPRFCSSPRFRSVCRPGAAPSRIRSG